MITKLTMSLYGWFSTQRNLQAKTNPAGAAGFMPALLSGTVCASRAR